MKESHFSNLQNVVDVHRPRMTGKAPSTVFITRREDNNPNNTPSPQFQFTSINFIGLNEKYKCLFQHHRTFVILPIVLVEPWMKGTSFKEPEGTKVHSMESEILGNICFINILTFDF